MNHLCCLSQLMIWSQSYNKWNGGQINASTHTQVFSGKQYVPIYALYQM